MGKRKKSKASEYEFIHERGFTRGWFDFRDHTVCFSYWKNGRRKVKSAESDWYCCMRKEDYGRINERRLDEYVDDVEEDGKWLKLYLPFFGERRRDLISYFDRVGFQLYEADVNPVDRYVLDHDIKISSTPRILYFDLETDVRAGWDDIEQHKIVSVAYGEWLGDLTCKVVKDLSKQSERQLINRFLKVARDYDVLVAWNSSAYDEPVLKGRCKELGIYVNWWAIGFLDLMYLFKQNYRRDETGSGVRLSFALDNIAKTVLGVGKEDDIQVAKMHEEVIQRPEQVKKYNKRDVEIMMQLESKFRFISSHAVLASLCNRFLDDRSMLTGYLADGFILKYSVQNTDVRWPTKRGWDTLKNQEFQKIPGAYVMEPVVGLHRGVCDLDFSSLYPSIMISLNVSPEKLIEDVQDENLHWHCLAGDGSMFSKDEVGIFPAIAKVALEARQEFKSKVMELEEVGKDGTDEHRKMKQKSDSRKVLANTLYGILSAPTSRYYSPDCGEAITTTGQKLIQVVIELAREKGIEVLYGDTDSIFVKASREIATEFSGMAVRRVKEWLREHNCMTDEMMGLKLDAEFERILLIAKKRYAGKKVTGKWDVRGLELVRSDGCKYAREMQRKLLTFFLEAKNLNPDRAEKIVLKWADRLYRKEVEVDDLVMSQSLSKDLNEYKVESVHVRIARDMKERGFEVYQGMKIPYVIVGKKDGRLNAIHANDFDGEFDAKLYWKTKVYPATERLLRAAWSKEEKRWKRLLKYELDEVVMQPSLKFESNDLEVVFKLPSDEHAKMDRLAKIVKKYPGSHVLRLRIDIGESEVFLSTGSKVALKSKLVREVEKLFGCRVYFGSENWEGEN